MKHCSFQGEVDYLNMQIVLRKAELFLWNFLLLLIRYGGFYSSAQGGIQAGTGVKTLLGASRR